MTRYLLVRFTIHYSSVLCRALPNKLKVDTPSSTLEVNCIQQQIACVSRLFDDGLPTFNFNTLIIHIQCDNFIIILSFYNLKQLSPFRGYGCSILFQVIWKPRKIKFLTTFHLSIEDYILNDFLQSATLKKQFENWNWLVHFCAGKECTSTSFVLFTVIMKRYFLPSVNSLSLLDSSKKCQMCLEITEMHTIGIKHYYVRHGHLQVGYLALYGQYCTQSLHIRSAWFFIRCGKESYHILLRFLLF